MTVDGAKATCDDCGQQLTAGNRGMPGRCITCTQRRYRQKLAEVYMMTSEGSLLTSSGWNNAGMLDGEPAVWLCDHGHPTGHEAEACLDLIRAEGGVDWRFRSKA